MPESIRPVILLADDQPDVRDCLRHILTTSFEIISVTDPAAVVAAAREYHPILVIAGVNSDALLSALRQDPATQDIPVILVSAGSGKGLADLTARVELACAGGERRQAGADDQGMVRLHEFSARLLKESELQPALQQVLDGVMALLNADAAAVLLRDPETHVLTVAAQRGIPGEAMNWRGHAEDAQHPEPPGDEVLADPVFRQHLEMAAAAGCPVVQSAALLSHGGESVGVISAHFREPHHSPDHELRLLSLYARQAAGVIEHIRTRDALRASEVRSRRYFELGLVGMATTSVSKGILEVNDEFCRILGYDRSDLLGRTWAELTHPEDLDADVTQFNRVLAGEIDGYSLDKRWIRKNGQVIHTIMAAKCVRRPDGAVDYFVGLVLDITDRKRAEQLLERETDERTRLLHRVVAAQDEERRRIARDLHDDLTQRLALIEIELELLRQKDTDLSALTAQRLASAIQHVHSLMEDVRQLSHRLHPTVLEELGLVPAVRSLVEQMEQLYDLRLRLIAPLGFPRVPLPIASALYYITQEALANAAKYARGAMVTITLSWTGEELRLRVQDDGPGFDPEAVRHKAGLGLVSMRERAEFAGGVFALHAAVGAGAAIQVTVPWSDAQPLSP